MQSMRKKASLMLMAVALLSPSLLAGQVSLKNGDRD